LNLTRISTVTSRVCSTLLAPVDPPERHAMSADERFPSSLKRTYTNTLTDDIVVQSETQPSNESSSNGNANGGNYLNIVSDNNPTRSLYEDEQTNSGSEKYSYEWNAPTLRNSEGSSSVERKDQGENSREDRQEGKRCKANYSSAGSVRLNAQNADHSFSIALIKSALVSISSPVWYLKCCISNSLFYIYRQRFL